MKFRPKNEGLNCRVRDSFFSKISKSNSCKKLVIGKNSIDGRGANGRIAVRFRGGGHKRNLRKLDFCQEKVGVSSNVASIGYDPCRSAYIALLKYLDGAKRYVVAPTTLQIGDVVKSGPDADISVGNRLPLRNLPLGIEISSVELRPGKGGQLVRSAGVSARLMAKGNSYATIRLPSCEVRLVHLSCSAVIGSVSNVNHKLINFGKAGRMRWFGRKPHNRGVSMNPVDHPMGGGEGKTSGGRHPTSPWGQLAKGYRTRHNKRTQSMRVSRRKK